MEYNVRQINNFIGEYAENDKYRKDKDITLAVLGRSPSLAAYADKKLLNDKDVALAAVERDGRTLRFFSDKIRADEDVVYAAVKNFRSSYAFALGKARLNARIAELVASGGGDTVSLLDESFLDDEEIAKTAVGRNPKSIQYFSDRVKCLPSVALTALKQDRTCSNFLPDEAFASDAVFRAAIRLTDDGKVGVGVINQFTPIGVFKKLEEENMRFNFSLQNLDLMTLDGERLRYVIELGLGVTGKKAELFHKFVDADDRETVAFLLAKKIPSAKTMANELEYASKNRKLRVLPLLISATRGGKRPVNETSERRILMRNLKRKSPAAVGRFIDSIDVYAHDEDIGIFTKPISRGIKISLRNVLTDTSSKTATSRFLKRLKASIWISSNAGRLANATAGIIFICPNSSGAAKRLKRRRIGTGLPNTKGGACERRSCKRGDEVA